MTNKIGLLLAVGFMA